jgi:prepilin-type N-terminal cleavage/methylation domain-containing protein
MSNIKCQISNVKSKIQKLFSLDIRHWTFGIGHLKFGIRHSNAGFTIQELLVVMAVMAILLGIVVMNLVTIQNRTNLDAANTTLIAEIKQQQLKAMVGDTEGRTTPDAYGIRFDTNSYTFFHGTTYNASDPDNFTIDMDDNMQFSSIQLPNQSVVFNRVSGDFYNYNPALSSVTLTNTTAGESKTLQFNRYGVIRNND